MMSTQQIPIMFLGQNTRRQQGRKVQLDNIQAVLAVSDVIKTCLGPKAMMKMLIDPMSGITITNDGNAILRDISVMHPAAKAIIDISRTQDEEVGDGTTSVVILAAELLGSMGPFLEQNAHPVLLIRALKKALADIVQMMTDKSGSSVCSAVSEDEESLVKIVNSCLQTKFASHFGECICRMAIQSVKLVDCERNGRREIDFKRYARIERIPGGSLSDSRVVEGIALNKDVLHPRMPRRIVSPKVVLLDSALEYTKGESQTMMELSKESHFTRALELEDEEIKEMVNKIVDSGANLVITEKGISDLAIHLLTKAGIAAIRRVKKTDNERLSRVTGATVYSDPTEIEQRGVGKDCGLFYLKQLDNGEVYAFFEECSAPKACTILLRGPSKDFIDEMARNLEDAMCVVRNILLDPFVAPGGGAVEMELSQKMQLNAKQSKDEIFKGVEKFAYLACASALEVIPRLLIENSGNSMVIQTLMSLRVAHSGTQSAGLSGANVGIDGDSGDIIDTFQKSIVEPRLVKLQMYKSAFETAITLIRVDDIVSGSKKGTDLDEKRGNEQRDNIEKGSKDAEQ